MCSVQKPNLSAMFKKICSQCSMIPIYYTQGSKEDTWDKFGSLRTSHYGSIISGFLLYVDENLFMPFDDEDDEDDEM
nr:unnamed protein product [Callosobruchus chinensis]